MRVIAITNRKGGIGKTTTAAALALWLSNQGHRVLAIDLDGQHNLSDYAGVSTKGATIYGILKRENSIKAAIQAGPLFDIIASNESMDNIDTELTDIGKEIRLKEALPDIEPYYDFVVIDTPPAMNNATICALCAADDVIIPAAADMYSFTGIKNTFEIIELARKYYNPKLKTIGVLITRIKNTNIGKEFIGLMEKEFKAPIFSGVRESVAINKATAFHKSYFDEKSNPALDYQAFFETVFDEYKKEDK